MRVSVYQHLFNSESSYRLQVEQNVSGSAVFIISWDNCSAQEKQSEARRQEMRTTTHIGICEAFSYSAATPPSGCFNVQMMPKASAAKHYWSHGSGTVDEWSYTKTETLG